MNERLKDIFDEGNCLTEKQLRLYVNGQLTPVEQNFVEQHLSSCELCSDALEGIQLMQDPENLKNINEELKENVKTLLNGNSEKEIKVIFPWRIAASFVLIFVSGLMLWFFLPKHDNDTLFTQEYKPYPVEEKQAVEKQKEQQLASSPLQQENFSNQNAAQPEIKPQIIREAEKVNEVNAESEIKEYNTVAEPATASEEKVRDDITAASTSTVSADSKTNKSEEVIFSAKKTEARQKIENTKDASNTLEGLASKYDTFKSPVGISEKSYFISNTNYDSAMIAYKNADYAKAVELFNKIKNKPEALFYAAVSYLSLNQPKETIRLMNSYRETGAKNLAEESYWYEALANLKRDDKKEVKKLLNKVIEFNGTYRARAEELLQKM